MITTRRRPPAWPFALRPTILATAGVAAIVVGHAVAASRPTDEATPLVLATHAYALLLLVGLLWLAAALGRAVMRHCGVQGESRLEHGVFTVAIGLGLMATIVLGLGLTHLLTTPALAIALATLALLARHDLVALGHELPDIWGGALAVRRSLRQQGRILALLVPIAEILLGALLVHALAPPTSNDVLTYHLQGPRRFLELGGMAPQHDIQQANMPLAVNMLYLLGLAFGSDRLGGVLHLSLAVLVAVATFGFGRRFFGERVGWIAATTFVSTQLMLVFATVAFVDYGLAYFDFLAVYAFIVWRQSGSRGWLVVSGLLVGCALATKLLGAITAVSLGVWLLALVLRRRTRLGASDSLGLLLVFGLPAALIACPWYLKNLLWFGNPVWPFLAGNPNDFNMYLGGTTRFSDSDGILGALLLPIYLYARGSVEYPAIRPPLQLLALPFCVLVPRHRVVTTLLALAAVQFIVWSQGAHLLRYLLQALPALSVVAAYVLICALSAPRQAALTRPLVTGLMLAGLMFPTVITVAVVLADGSMAQFVGLESRQAYLDRKLHNSHLVSYLNGDHEPVGRVLMIGDNRSFYLHQPAWVDVSLEVFQSVALAPDTRTARDRLAERGITHVLVNSKDLFWYAPFDPERRIETWWDRFENGRAGYLEPVAANEDSTLYRVSP